jgi:transposase
VKGEKMVSARRAAKMLDVHVNSVREWCLRAEKGMSSKLPNAQRNYANGYFQVPISDIETLKSGKNQQKNDK